MTNRNRYRNSSRFQVNAILIAVLMSFIFIAGPFISIWALNTLFGLGISYNFWTWLAMAWAMMVIGGVHSSVSK